MNGQHIENWPDHLTIEPWDYINVNHLDFFEGNIVKYITRWRLKNGLDDLKKARAYLDKLIMIVEEDDANEETHLELQEG